MAYNTQLATRIAEFLDRKMVNYTEKKMFGGVAFMINDKMCVGVTNDKLMLRVMDEHYEPALKKKFVYPMDFNGRSMKGFLFIEEGAYTGEKDLDHWIDLGLEFGKLGKVKSKKK